MALSRGRFLCAERFLRSCDHCAALGSRVGSGVCFYRVNTCEQVMETGEVHVSICLLEGG